MSTFSDALKLAAVTALLVLTACSTNKPPAAGTGMTSSETIIPGSRRDFEVNAGDRVFFDFDSADIRPDAAATLQKQAEWLKRYASVTVTVEGHCDERGTREYNLALGARRASATKEYLIGQGISASRLDTISYGKEKPMCVESSEGCWAQNRRAVSVISGGVSS